MKKLVVFAAIAAIIVLAFVGLAQAGEPYTIDGNGKYTALVDHYMVVNLLSDATVGILITAGSTFSTPEMYQLSNGFNTPVSEQLYKGTTLQQKAIGPNAATLIVKKLNSNIKEIEKAKRQDAERRRSHPEMGERVRRRAERRGEDFIDHTIDEALHEVFRGIFR